MYLPVPLDDRLAAILPEGSLFAVGGRVRDELRADLEGATLSSKDLDYVITGLPIEEIVTRLRGLGRVDVVGASFAVLKLTTDGQGADLALPRRERSTGTGHREFEIESGPEVSLEEDLARRDFRMNMMARALPSGRLIDPYGGERDIRARRIDILKPASFREDPLRMLRAAQFAARFEYVPTAQLREAMAAAAGTIGTVSAERIQDEFRKLFAQASKPSIGLELLHETGVLTYLWPELLEGVGVEQNEWHAYDVWRHSLATVDASPLGDVTLRLAALLHDVGKPRAKDICPHFYRHEIIGAELTRSMLERFRFPNDVVQTTEHLVRQHMYSADPDMGDAAVRRFIRRIEPQNIVKTLVRVATRGYSRQRTTRAAGQQPGVRSSPRASGALRRKRRGVLRSRPGFSAATTSLRRFVRRGEAPPAVSRRRARRRRAALAFRAGHRRTRT